MYNGSLKYDKYHLVWCYDGDSWIPVTEDGEQVKYSDHRLTVDGFRLQQFPAAEDPSGEDPRIVTRLDRIEKRLARIESAIGKISNERQTS